MFGAYKVYFQTELLLQKAKNNFILTLKGKVFLNYIFLRIQKNKSRNVFNKLRHEFNYFL
jgi:hypothetical protein